jgi:hypothetical protein
MEYKCKGREKEYKKQYRLENKEKIKEANRQYRLKNKEKAREYFKKWHIDNPEKQKEYNRQWYIKTREKRLEYGKQYRLNNIEKERERCRKYRLNNKGKRKEYKNQWIKNKRRTDLKFNLNSRITIAIYASLKGNKNGRHWENLVGYTLNDLYKRLQKTMPENYTWKDYMEGGLHIDHIIPLSVWSFSKPEDIEFKKCWALENLQLLPAEDNLRKYNKIELF